MSYLTAYLIGTVVGFALGVAYATHRAGTVLEQLIRASAEAIRAEGRGVSGEGE